MSSLENGYTNRRAYQGLENLGAGRDAAAKSKFEQTNIENNNGQFSKVGRNPKDGVAVKVEDYSTLDVSPPGFMTPAEATAKAERTGVTNVREDSGYFVAEDPSLGKVIMGKVKQIVKDTGKAVGQAEILMNAPFAGLTRGVARFAGNVLGATGVVDQKQIDSFFGQVDKINQTATEGQPGAAIVGGAADIAGQFIIPTVGVYSKLISLGAAPVVASMISEAGVGLLGMTPNQENLFNMIPEDSDTFKMVKELMQTNPDSPEWVNRAKNAGEALSLFGAGEVAVRGTIKAIENAKRLSDSPVLKRMFSAIDNADAQLKADKAAGITRMRSGGDSTELLAAGKPLADALRGGKPAPTFFSAVEKAVEALPMEKGSAQQMRAMIGKTARVKPEEMAWIGLDDFLAGKKSITKQEILDYVRANKVEIKTKIKNENAISKKDQARLDLAMEKADSAHRDFEDALTEKEKNSRHISDLRAHANDPDAMNEIIPKLPESIRSQAEKWADAKEALDHVKASIYDSEWAGAGPQALFHEHQLPGGKNYREVLLTLPKRESASDNFTRGHFPEPNVLVHIRMNDRVGPNGEKVLFLEEIQSDWHQRGKKQGYAPPSGVPDAPFKKTWYELAFRRAARMAAEEGYDTIAWTPGKVQAERYDLSKQISKVTAIQEPGKDTFNIRIDGKNGDTIDNISGVDANELSDMVGKDLANKIIKDNGGIYAGLDLRVGGEGMKTFYDKMVKNYASKFGKKFGAKVGTTKIGTGEAASDSQNVWSLPITDKMRKSVITQGVPLFSLAPASLAPLTADKNQQNQPPKNIQMASAASRFLEQLLKAGKGAGGEAAGKGASKTARLAQDILDSNYTKFKDNPQADLFGALEPVISDFNIANINITNDVKSIINRVSQAYASEILGKTKGVVSHQVTQDLATLLGETLEGAANAVKSLPSDVKDLHVRALTMRNLLVASAERTDRLARIIRDSSSDISDADYLRLLEQIARQGQLQAQMKGVQTEIARAVSAFRIPAEASQRDPQIISEILDRMGGRSTAKEIADRWLSTPIDRRAKFAALSVFARTRNAIFEVWINGLLSGLRTHQVNTFGNLAFTMFQIPERVGAATIGAITRSPDRVRFKEAYSMLVGASEGAIDGIRLAWKAWKTEMPADGVSKIEAQQIRSISPEAFYIDPNSLAGKAADYIGQGVRMPGRSLMSEDEFFKSISYRMELRALTTRNILNARDEGKMADLILETSKNVPETNAADAAALTKLRETATKRNLAPDELGQLKDLMLANPGSDVSGASHDFATMTTFQTQLGRSGRALQSAVGAIPGARVVLPFIRTPTNIIKEFGRRNPLLAPLMPSVGADIKAGGARRDLALAKIGLGTGLMSYAMLQAMEGNITGGGPKPGQGTYAQWRQTHQPYSVKIGDRWVPYGRIEPLALLFGSVADAVDFIKYSSDDTASEKVYLAAFVGVMKNIGDKTFLRGIADFSDAYSDPDRYAERYFAQLARTAIPFSSMVRDITRAVDPISRETRPDSSPDSPTSSGLQRILNEFKSVLPGFSKDLPPKRTFWGEPRMAYEGGPGVAFFAFSTRKIKKSPIDTELVRLNQPLRLPSRRVGSFELSWKQYDRLIVLMNKTPIELGSAKLVQKYGVKSMRSAMNNLVQSALWKAIESNDVKASYLLSIRNDYIDAAREALAREDLSVSNAKIQEDADKLLLKGQKSVLQQLGPLSTQIQPPTLNQ